MVGISTKSQAPNTKQIPLPAGRQERTKIENTKQNCLGNWDFELGNHLGFGIWNLEFMANHLSKDQSCSL